MRDTLSRIFFISISYISLYLLNFSHQVKLILEYKVFNVKKCDQLILSICPTIIKGISNNSETKDLKEYLK